MKITISLSNEELNELRQYLAYKLVLKNCGLVPTATVADKLSARLFDVWLSMQEQVSKTAPTELTEEGEPAKARRGLDAMKRKFSEHK